LAIEAGPTLGPRIQELWLEFERGETVDAKAVCDLDSYECLAQLFEYEKKNLLKQDDEMFDDVFGQIVTPEVLGWANELKKRTRGFLEEEKKCGIYRLHHR
jgi:putative hydrolase of HD superfamily